MLDPTTNKKGPASGYLQLVLDTDLTFSDVTTGDVSTAKHGYAPKAPNDVTKVLNGAGAYAVNSGVIIGFTAYAAGTDTTLHTQPNNTMTDMDATNAAVTFTAPASGNVLVVCSVLHGNSTSGDTYWGLRESTTTVATAYARGSVASQDFGIRTTVQFYVTGISAGSHTYKLAHRVTAGSASAFTGPNYGQVILEVRAMP
jgi:hypothetical protein